MVSDTKPGIKTRPRGRRLSPGPGFGPASTPKLPSAKPPDYISIPDHLRAQPAYVLVGSRRVQRLFEQANIRRLGDLDGKRLSDFAGYRGCSKMTLWELRRLLLRVLHPDVEPDLTTWPILMSDYQPPGPTFAVPEMVRAISPRGLPISFRLEHVLNRLGVECLGDLAGISVKKVLDLPCCGRKTLAELQSLLQRAATGEFSRADHKPTTPSFVVPEVARALCPRNLPISVRLNGVLSALRIRCLGDLADISVQRLRSTLNCGTKTLSELQDLLQRAANGDFALTDQQLGTSTPADLLSLVDDLISRLPDRDRQILRLRFGADGDACKSLRQLGIKYDLTINAIHLAVARSLGRIRSQGCAKLRSLLTHFLDPCRCKAPLSPVLLATWIDRTCPPRHSLQFYARIIPKLRLNVGVKGQVSGKCGFSLLTLSGAPADRSRLQGRLGAG